MGVMGPGVVSRRSAMAAWGCTELEIFATLTFGADASGFRSDPRSGPSAGIACIAWLLTTVELLAARGSVAELVARCDD